MINAPIYFTAIWAMVRPWIDAVTVEKIQIFGSNYGDALKTYVNLDQIPVEYGGTNESFPWTSPLNNVGYNEVVTPVEVIKEYATGTSEPTRHDILKFHNHINLVNLLLLGER